LLLDENQNGIRQDISPVRTLQSNGVPIQSPGLVKSRTSKVLSNLLWQIPSLGPRDVGSIKFVLESLQFAIQQLVKILFDLGKFFDADFELLSRLLGGQRSDFIESPSISRR